MPPDSCCFTYSQEHLQGEDLWHRPYLVSVELIAYIKWLIYVAAFKDRGNVTVAHELYYNTEVVYLRSAGAQWRNDLYEQLVAWHGQHPPGKKRSRASDGGASIGIGAFGREYKCVDADEFVDPFDDEAASAARLQGDPA